MTITLWLTSLVVFQRIIELAIARRNERRAREAGAIEIGHEHYWMFFVLHPAWLLGWTVEGWDQPVSWGMVGAYAALQIFRAWILWSLGPAWNTRILVLPGTERVTRGPYRFLAHPNYVLVALELIVTPLAVGGWKTALAATVANAWVMAIRIPAEEKALRDHLGKVERSSPGG